MPSASETTPLLGEDQCPKSSQGAIVPDFKPPQDELKAHSIFTRPQKILIVIIASLAAFFSPVSSAIYFPALGTLADALGVSVSLINLTVTTYLVMQGLAPSFIGSWSDRAGRRPLYIACFVIYIGSNIGLALQTNYVALLILRMVQSAGSSPLVSLAQAVVADMATSAERGRYISYVTSGAILGPAVGPLIGGMLIQSFGWRSVFWFLAIFAGVVFLLMLACLPETCRAVVGDGSIPPPTWIHMSWLAYRHRRQIPLNGPPMTISTSPAAIRPGRKASPTGSLRVIADRETSLILIYAGCVLAGYQMVSANLSEALSAQYAFNTFQVGLCFLPFGAGAFLATLTTGHIVDWNFRRLARIHHLDLRQGRQQDLSQFPIEKARLQVGMPIVGVGALSVLVYGWTMQARTPLAVPLVALFVVGWTVSSSTNSISVLIVDLHLDTPATATAANNLVRCWMGALAVAVMGPAVEAIGIGWMGTVICAVYIGLLPMLMLVWRKGPTWRREKREKWPMMT
uniref:Major facilitator superfamily transporter n=1 Tax=Paecilomyces divaricatus TaxID=644132 RepID=A0A3G1IHI5_PAEDI|nr:major facilitator superfamily transporter [Paecilomyces divaricatus]